MSELNLEKKTTRELPIQKEINNNKLVVFGLEEFPLQVQEGVNEILDIVQNNISLPQLYEKELKETMVSTSIFQDICVQMEEHHTPNRKLRQVMLELGDKLDALDAAKNGHKKNIVKIQTLECEVEDIQSIYEDLQVQGGVIDFDLALRLSTVKYTTSQGMDNIQVHEVIPSSVLDIISRGQIIDNKQFIKTISDKVKIALGNKIVDHSEALRGMESSKHMIKDSAVKAYQLRIQAEKYKKEVEESGLTYDESEIIYYTMYFTAEAERQLRTGDHQIDRGTYKAMSQLPEFIRLKVLKNVDYIKNKMNKELGDTNSFWASDYYFHTDRDILEPHFERDENGDLIVEGVKVKDYLLMEMINILSKEE